MNLIAKITVLNLLLALVAFGIGGVRVYHKFRHEIQRETDYTLRESLAEAVQTIRSGVPASDLQNRFMYITPADTVTPADTHNVFSDTLANHPALNRPELFRQLTTTRNVDGHFYRFTIMNVIIEQSDISRITENILSDLFVLLGAILLVFNFLISKWLLHPFQVTLEKIKFFNLKSGEIPELPQTTTTEFRQLNTFLTAMLHQVRKDYRALKEFSENASHEMQTPLAVASGKLELLVESPGLDSTQLQLIQDAQQALSHLSKLGEALLFLTKIENREFATQAPINFSALLTADLSTFGELAGMKGLQFSTEIKPDVQLRIDPVLAHILVGNLLKNAIRHNVDGGWIKVRLDTDCLTISNSGPDPGMPTEQLFERFQKSDQTGRSLGLGLAIVKKICEANSWQVHYTYAGGVHEITVRVA